jgi:hypothetical protein
MKGRANEVGEEFELRLLIAKRHIIKKNKGQELFLKNKSFI